LDTGGRNKTPHSSASPRSYSAGAIGRGVFLQGGVPVGRVGNPSRRKTEFRLAIIVGTGPRLKATPMTDVTRILSAIEQGDPTAAEQLLPLVYGELRRLAAEKMADEKPGQTLQATALVHEAYLRLADVEKVQHWNSRGHFFGAAAEAMRRILVDQARKRRSQRRGGGLQKRPIEDIEIAVPEPSVDLLALNEALERFGQSDRVAADLVKLRYYAGLTIPQAADALGISSTTADRYWAYARAWLHAELKKGDQSTDQ
jgi:RNA polymerase sigma factor (TIGR02999 family)